MTAYEQVADLRPGDVVELFRNSWPDGTVVRGALYEAGGWLYVAEEAVRREDGRSALAPSYSLTVISRVPRPLYVNHDRTKPVPGDVVRDADSDDVMRVAVYVRKTDDDYWALPSGLLRSAVGPPFGNTLRYGRLRLLVDGETGMTVPS